MRVFDFSNGCEFGWSWLFNDCAVGLDVHWNCEGV